MWLVSSTVTSKLFDIPLRRGSHNLANITTDGSNLTKDLAPRPVSGRCRHSHTPSLPAPGPVFI